MSITQTIVRVTLPTKDEVLSIVFYDIIFDLLTYFVPEYDLFNYLHIKNIKNANHFSNPYSTSIK